MGLGEKSGLDHWTVGDLRLSASLQAERAGPEGQWREGGHLEGPKPGAARVWCTTVVPGGARQQVCGFNEYLEPSPHLTYSAEASQFLRISLRTSFKPTTVLASRGSRRHQFAGRLTVLGYHERVPLLQELHDPTETPPCLRYADHLHAEASHGEENVDGVEGGQHP